MLFTRKEHCVVSALLAHQHNRNT